ncbi:Angiogenic factor with G patch and FHA domains 1 [Vanrija pseudolonga]|uniref:Angiogenic factor with G patch and FHA domains 1 n=1 Tax=Vanrija pseudolonga TaxID=143232 RepID=A0AAF0XZ10_9TREE|nr:Angiogenic factor with G patch and FHA domains 1 [Vanrija pseudolonga]
MPASTTDARAEAWVWNAALGVYYQAASDTYALASASGEWTYLTPAELAEGKHTTSSNAAAGPSRHEREEGEVLDDVGWGGLMAPEDLARAVGDKSGGKGEEKKRPEPATKNGYDPYGRKGDPYGRDASSDNTPDRHASASPPPIPPHILRLVVKRSRALQPGAVAVLDAREGGIQLGRDRCERGAAARVRVREMEVSKTHALVYWGSGASGGADPDAWHVVDLGSTLGTYVAHPGERDATRLSEAKASSQPYPLRHLSRLTVGTTTFVAHIHADWPCVECQMGGNEQIALDEGKADDSGVSTPTYQPDSEPVAFDAAQRRGNRQFKRKLELDALRGTLLGDGAREAPSAAYVDRSAQRRRLHPRSPPRAGVKAVEAAPAPAPAPGPSTTARAMLARQGWSEGRGLGRDLSGRADAIVPVLRTERAGLGARGQLADTGDAAHGDWRQRGKQRRWDEVGRS